MKTLHIASAALLTLFAVSAVALQDDADAKTADGKKAEVRVGDPYILDTCPVSGEELGSMGDPVTLIVEGREVKLCCNGCVKKMKADPAKYFATADKAIIADQRRIYPLDTCLVSGEELIEPGKDVEDPAVDFVVGNRLFRVCCNMCATKVQKDPTTYFAKLDAAVIKDQLGHYPLENCIVREKSKLGSMGDPMQIVVANRLVQFCCKGCLPKFHKDPAKYLAKLDAAWMKMHGEHGDGDHGKKEGNGEKGDKKGHGDHGH